jgi:hypothetical protein
MRPEITVRKVAGRPGLLGRIGRTCHRHRWLTLLIWSAAWPA